MRRRRNPVPILAALPWLYGAATTALIGWGLYAKGERDIQEEAAYGEYRAGLEPPRRPPAPPAPQTREELTRWTPADLERQAALEWERWRRQALPEPPAPPAKQPDPWVWLGAAAAALGLILVVKQ